MKPRKHEYLSDFARGYFALGEARGRVALIIRLLTLRFGPVSASIQDQIEQTSIAELDAIGERLLGAQSIDEVLGSH